MRFEATDGENLSVMDAPRPFGDGRALSPKQHLLAAICGCSGVDVAARMRKNRQGMTGLRIEADAPKREGKPSTFNSVALDFHFEGEVDPALALEAVAKSQSEECGVSAMVATHCPISYRVFLNGKLLGEGSARFPAASN